MIDQILAIGGYAAITTITAIALAVQGILAATIIYTILAVKPRQSPTNKKEERTNEQRSHSIN